MIKTLIAGPQDDAVYQWMVDGLRAAQRDLNRQLEMQLKFCNIHNFDELNLAIEKEKPSLLLLSFHWKTPLEEAISYLQALYTREDRPRIVYLDYYDQSSTPFFPILPWVDMFWRKQLMQSLDSYNNQNWIGGNLLSDLASRLYNADIGDWHFGSMIPLGYEDRIGLSWNVATNSKISRRARLPILRSLPSPRKRDIDIFCRVSTRSVPGDDPNDIYYLHRTACLNALEPLKARYRVESNFDGSKVPLKVFQQQLRHSKIAFSPWGWGEITDRDFAIVNAGALLMKPDVSHLRTDPNVFIADETYVPIKWDLSDLEEKCDHYLCRPESMKRIAGNAKEAYSQFFRQQTIVNKLQQLTNTLSLA